MLFSILAGSSGDFGCAGAFILSACASESPDALAIGAGALRLCCAAASAGKSGEAHWLDRLPLMAAAVSTRVVNEALGGASRAGGLEVQALRISDIGRTVGETLPFSASLVFEGTL